MCFYIIAAEQKARAVYDNILKLSDDPDVNEVIKFLREREIVHFQRFGEAKRKLTSKQKAKSLCCFAALINLGAVFVCKNLSIPIMSENEVSKRKSPAVYDVKDYVSMQRFTELLLSCIFGKKIFKVRVLWPVVV